MKINLRRTSELHDEVQLRGQSGMTSEHLFPFLESGRTLASVCQVAGFLARAEVPQSILSALWFGRA